MNKNPALPQNPKAATGGLIAITKEQWTIRDECVRVCKEHYKATLQFAVAFRQLHDDKLYLATHPTWESFCHEVLGVSKRHVNRLLMAIEIKSTLPAAIAASITTETQARALAGVPEPAREGVLEAALKSGKLTPSSIIEAAQKLQTGPKVPLLQTANTGKSILNDLNLINPIEIKKNIELDEVGSPITEDALPFWHRRQEIQDMLTKISDMKMAIERGKASEDPMFGKVSNAALIDLSRAYTHVATAKPYAVCTECQGAFSAQPHGCASCANTGLICKSYWDTSSRQEIKDMRARLNAARK